MDKLNTPRELKGLAILSQGDTITTINNNSWIVKSQTGIGEYQVCKKINTGLVHVLILRKGKWIVNTSLQ